MMDWVAKMLGLDASFHNESNAGGGIIMVRPFSLLPAPPNPIQQGSASEACLTVCIAARERALRILPGTTAEKLVLYGTTQTHSLGAKAALILGLEFRAIETKAEDDWSLRGETLREALEEDKARGKVPFILCVFGSVSAARDGADEGCSGDGWIDFDGSYR